MGDERGPQAPGSLSVYLCPPAESVGRPNARTLHVRRGVQVRPLQRLRPETDHNADEKQFQTNSKLKPADYKDEALTRVFQRGRLATRTLSDRQAGAMGALRGFYRMLTTGTRSGGETFGLRPRRRRV